MSNMVIKEQNLPKNWNKVHKQRLNDILTGIKPHFEKINADHLCNIAIQGPRSREILEQVQL